MNKYFCDTCGEEVRLSIEDHRSYKMNLVIGEDLDSLAWNESELGKEWLLCKSCYDEISVLTRKWKEEKGK